MLRILFFINLVWATSALAGAWSKTYKDRVKKNVEEMTINSMGLTMNNAYDKVVVPDTSKCTVDAYESRFSEAEFKDDKVIGSNQTWIDTVWKKCYLEARRTHANLKYNFK